MGDEVPLKVDQEPAPVEEKEKEEEDEELARNGVAEGKVVIPPPPDQNKNAPPVHEIEGKFVIPPPPDQNKTAPPVKEKIADPAVEKSSEGAIDRDAVLAQVTTEKRLALIKAWEESEKTKAENKAYKNLSAVGSWENSKKVSVEAQLKQIEEKFDKKKVEYAEQMKNKIAELHKAAEERRATIEAKRREDFLKVEEMAKKFRSNGYTPKKFLGCFSF
ncbi:remorin [Quercus suber]|uniref:remorin n=1 Tax=Quercus suber TaxID=58331 RepID=UPI000CE24543|nr:remorin-like [Quercus suber]POE92639.1 remorin [Quercus suber]